MQPPRASPRGPDQTSLVSADRTGFTRKVGSRSPESAFSVVSLVAVEIGSTREDTMSETLGIKNMYAIVATIEWLAVPTLMATV